MAERIFDLYRKAWLRAFYPHYTIDRTTRLFNERFGTSLTREQIRNAANRFKCGPGKDPQRFAPGHVPRNKGRKGHYPPGSEKGWFRKGEDPVNTRPLYSERWDRAGDGDSRTPVLMIKIPGAAPYASQKRAGAHQKTRWVRKAVWVWERERGPVPEGHAIVQLDGDPANCDPGNLDCAPRAALAMLNVPWAIPPAGPELNPVRVRIAQVRAGLSMARRNGNPSGNTQTGSLRSCPDPRFTAPTPT